MAVDQDPTEATAARRDRARRRALPAVFISLGLHILVLLAAVVMVPHPVFRNYSPDEKPISVALLPPTELERARPRPSKMAPTAPQLAATLALPLPHLHTPASPPPSVAPSPLLAPAAPHPGPVVATPKPGTSIAPGPLPADETPRGVSAMLRRSVGCDYAEAVHLSPEEKEACAKRFGDMARSAHPLSGISDEKRGEYSMQAAADERKRAAREGAMGQPVHVCEGVGSNFGAGCLNQDMERKFRVP